MSLTGGACYNSLIANWPIRTLGNNAERNHGNVSSTFYVPKETTQIMAGIWNYANDPASWRHQSKTSILRDGLRWFCDGYVDELRSWHQDMPPQFYPPASVIAVSGQTALASSWTCQHLFIDYSDFSLGFDDNNIFKYATRARSGECLKLRARTWNEYDVEVGTSGYCRDGR